MADEKGGFRSKLGRGAKRAGKAYVWTLTGDLSESRAAIKRMRQGFQRLLFGTYRTETFEEAIARLNVSEQSLQMRLRRLHAVAYVYALIVVVAAALLALAPWSPNPIPHALTGSGVLILTIVKWLVTRYRMAEIRQRTFFRFGDWLFRRSGQ